MKVVLLDNQIDLILKALESYTKINPEKLQLINCTYESLLEQKTSKQVISSKNKCNQNVI